MPAATGNLFSGLPAGGQAGLTCHNCNDDPLRISSLAGGLCRFCAQIASVVADYGPRQLRALQYRF
jgi:hypothetical protein